MRTNKGIIAILVLAAVVRLYAIGYDLPFYYDGDEHFFVNLAMKMLKNRSLNPHWFGHPGSTIIYLLCFIYLSIFILGSLFGVFQSPEDFRALFYRDPSIFFLSARMTSAVFGVLAIYLVYRIGKRLFNKEVGLLSAALLALSPLHIQFSMIVLVDCLLILLMLLAFYFALDIAEYGSHYLIAGVVTGLAIVTKYPAVVLIAIIVMAHFKSPQRQFRSLVKSGLGTIAGILVGAPTLVFNLGKVLSDVRVEAHSEHLSHTGAGLISNLWWYLSTVLPANLSFALLFAAVGCVVFFKDRRKHLLIVYPLLFLIFISSLSLRWDRWALPIIPFLAILGAGTLYRIARTASLRAILTTVIVVPLLIGGISQFLLFARPHTATLARTWIIDHVPTGSSVLAEGYGPWLPPTFHLYVVNKEGMIEEARSDGNNLIPTGTIGYLKDPKSDIQLPEYVVLSGMYYRYANERAKYPEIVSKYEEIIRNSELIYQFNPQANRGSQINVYRVNTPLWKKGEVVGKAGPW